MTEKECLEICRDLWAWMRDNKKTSHRDKSEHPKIVSREWNFHCNCSCCEYNQEQNNFKPHPEKCHYCPLLELWGETENGSLQCADSSTSPYKPFEDDKGTPELADQIVKFCERRLKEMT